MAQEQDEDFGAMLAAFDQNQPKTKARRPKAGDVVSGRIISIGKDTIFVDVGGKAEGVLERNQLSDGDGKLKVAVGDVVEARVTGDGGGVLQLRVKVARGPEAKAELVQAFDLGIPVDGLVTEVIKGGLSVDVAGVRGFCPASQIDNRFVEDLTPFVGQRLTFRITKYEASPRGGNLVLSRRALVEEEQKKNAAELRKTLVVGAVVRGKVTSFKPYGAFIDLGGMEGMLHVSELGFGRVNKPEDVLSVGQEVQVQILKMEADPDADKKASLGKRSQERISLSLKSLAADPWNDATRMLGEGSRVKGKVTRLADFGAFVELAPGIEGLVHIRALTAGKHVNHPRDVVKVGDEVEATVLAVDNEKRRISLSIAAANSNDGSAEDIAAVAKNQASGAGKLGTFGDLLKKFGK